MSDRQVETRFLRCAYTWCDWTSTETFIGWPTFDGLSQEWQEHLVARHHRPVPRVCIGSLPQSKVKISDHCRYEVRQHFELHFPSPISAGEGE